MAKKSLKELSLKSKAKPKIIENTKEFSLPEDLIDNTLNINVAKKNSTRKTLYMSNVNNPVLLDRTLDTKDNYTLILADRVYHEVMLNKIEMFFKSVRFTNYKIILPLSVKPDKDLLKGTGIKNFYRVNQNKWVEDYLVNSFGKKANTIITVGQALYCLNQDTLGGYEDFLDVIFNSSSFYSPISKTKVFPIPSFDDLFMNLQTFQGEYIDRENPNSPINAFPTKFTKYQIKRIKSNPSLDVDLTPYEIIIIKSLKQFNEILEANKNAEYIAWDIETSGFDFILDFVGCLTFSFDGIKGYYVSKDFLDIQSFNRFLSNPNLKQIGQNLKFDIKFMWQLGVTNAKVHYDTYQLGHVLNEMRSNSLKSHAYIYTCFGGYDQALDDYKSQTNVKRYTDIPEDILSEYATIDAIVTYRSFFKMKDQIDKIDKFFGNPKEDSKTMWYYYNNIVMPAVREFCQIEFKGVPVSRDTLNESRAWFLNEISSTSKKLCDKWSCTPEDLKSPTKLGKLLEANGLECLGRSKSGVYTTSDSEITRWLQQGYTEMEDLKYLRSLNTVLKAFISDSTNEEGSNKGWEQYIRYHKDKDEWRIHPSFGVMTTESGRSRSSNPNFQNIPAHGPLSSYVKKCIIPDNEEYVLSTADFASLQIRLAAMDTNYNYQGRDDLLYNVYTDPKLGGDLHSLTAWSIWCKNIKKDYEKISVVKEDGELIEFFVDEFINVVRDNNKIKIKAKDLLETDDLA